jgi:hypothetical protein
MSIIQVHRFKTKSYCYDNYKKVKAYLQLCQLSKNKGYSSSGLAEHTT